MAKNAFIKIAAKIAKQWGYVPYKYIGHGANGYVIEVIKGKKRYALKITNDQQDAEPYQKLLHLRESLPSFIRRSLPVIYRQEKIIVNNQPYWITLMEFLLPVPASILKAGWGTDTKFENAEYVNYVQKQKLKFIENIDLTLWRSLSSLSATTRKKVHNSVTSSPNWNYFKKIIKNELKIKQNDPDFFNSHLTNLDDIYDVLYSALKENAHEQHEHASIIASNVLLYIENEWKKMLPKQGEFPENYNYNDKSISDGNPKIKHLYTSLKWLVKKGIIHYWEDVHVQNVLMRPQTGDLVVADIGEFDFV